ncbi:MAG: Co2+/Mg2+ efflux protein ApaG [Flavobacteriales bacterium]|nr:Co2+/Mg2+ efflux protein ApaG [Flavobacteriales bacterium]
MSTTVTHDIRITASSRFEPAQSDPIAGRFFFSYRITIANTGRDTVQLKRRRWLIHDALAAPREVEGPGVVGETPMLRPGQEFTYTSACDLNSAYGRMEGRYTMLRLGDGVRFEVPIPDLHLLHPVAAN